MNICRAAETLTYFITANLVGKAENNVISVGNSMICDPLGTVVAGCDTYESGVFAEIDFHLHNACKPFLHRGYDISFERVDSLSAERKTFTVEIPHTPENKADCH